MKPTRPIGVTVSLGLWCLISPTLGYLALRAYWSSGRILPFPAGAAVVFLALALLILFRSRAAPVAHAIALAPCLILFPFTFPALVLLGYWTRGETRGYFEGDPEGPHWNKARRWRDGEWPWLLALAFATALMFLFGAMLLALRPLFPSG